MEWYLRVLKKYFVFQGRARRKEYWMFILVNIGISMVLTLTEMMTGMEGMLSGLYSAAILVPSLAVSVRRFHDTGKSGWWMLMNFVPIVGPIVFIFFMAKEGDAGSNEFGGNPTLEIEV